MSPNFPTLNLVVPIAYIRIALRGHFCIFCEEKKERKAKQHVEPTQWRQRYKVEDGPKTWFLPFGQFPGLLAKLLLTPAVSTEKKL